MPVLILGLLLPLGAHCVRMFATRWRDQQIARLGEKPWKGLFALVSIIGFVLIVMGFGVARRHPLLLYVPPLWLRQLNVLFTLVALCWSLRYDGRGLSEFQRLLGDKREVKFPPYHVILRFSPITPTGVPDAMAVTAATR